MCNIIKDSTYTKYYACLQLVITNQNIFHHLCPFRFAAQNQDA